MVHGRGGAGGVGGGGVERVGPSCRQSDSTWNVHQVTVSGVAEVLLFAL